MNEDWIEWESRTENAPVSSSTRVLAKRRDGHVLEAAAHFLEWQTVGSSGDIVAYRLAGPYNTPSDTIKSPSHYTNGKVEAIDAIEAATTGLEGIEAVCTGNVLKYIWRWKLKNGIEDLKKARWYLDRLIAKVEKDA